MSRIMNIILVRYLEIFLSWWNLSIGWSIGCFLTFGWSKGGVAWGDDFSSYAYMRMWSGSSFLLFLWGLVYYLFSGVFFITEALFRLKNRKIDCGFILTDHWSFSFVHVLTIDLDSKPVVQIYTLYIDRMEF